MPVKKLKQSPNYRMHQGQACPTPSLKIFLASFLFCTGFLPQLALSEIDTENRWQVREFFQTVYQFGDDATMQWTGDYSAADPGSVSPEWLEATRVRINFYRQLAGIPKVGEFNSIWNAKCQASSLIMSGNNTISHYPGEDWLFWTPEGAEAATGNLALNSAGRDSIDGYMVDYGSTLFPSSNKEVGHRRWILYPKTTEMGSGCAPGEVYLNEQNVLDIKYSSTNTLWVRPPEWWNLPRPDTRDDFVAWPPPGYVPSDLVWSRWHFSYPDADFDSATVSMTRNGESIPVYIEEGARVSVQQGYTVAPETGIIWVADNMPTTHRENWPTPDSDETIEVQVNNVKIDGQFYDFPPYHVTIIDAATAGLDESPTHDPGPETFVTNAPMVFRPASRSWSEGVQGRIIETAPFTQIFDAEESSLLLIDGTGETYEAIASGRNGNSGNVYHLAHSFPSATLQSLELPSQYLISGDSPTLNFDSSISVSTSRQISSVDINFGDGYQWQTIWTAPRVLVDYFENSFSNESIDLSPWTGHTARFRFRYAPDPSGDGSFFLYDEVNFGWAIDNITLTGVESVITSILTPYQEGRNFFVIESDSDSQKLIQSREFAFDGFALDWGPVSKISPVAFNDALLPQIGQWDRHPLLGNLFRATSDWSYSPELGWLYTAAGIWLWDGTYWMRYIMGNIEEGIWFYSPTQGFQFSGGQG